MLNPMIPRTIPTRPKGFTMIELLVVIAIIAVLAALAIPSFSSVMDRMTISKVQNDHMRGLTASMALYRADHTNKWPMPAATNNEYYSWYGPPTEEAKGKEVMKILRPYFGKGDIKEDGTFTDPWGNQYAMKWDINNSGSVEYYDRANKENIPKDFIIVSLGKNRTQDDPRDKEADDVFSFCAYGDTNYFK